MPELPEVETIRRGLEEYIIGKTIESVNNIHKGILEGNTSHITGQRIIDVQRIGKGLILHLANEYSIAIHIKLTGQLIFQDEKTKQIPVSKEKVGTLPNKFTHVVFELSKNSRLYYNDQRRFGWIRIRRKREVMDFDFFKNMGPEPFKDLTLERFTKIVNSQTKIKPLIMDQTRIGGIGNIYANDALFRARINPARPAKTLSKKEVKELFNSIIAVMEKSFEEGGASELSFVNILGQEGNYQRHALVYGKSGKPCPRGNGTIKRITIGGRGTFYCEVCQK